MQFVFLLGALVVSLILALLQHFALQNFWYWQYPWFDVPMHFIGGASLALFLIALLRKFHPLLFLFGMVILAVGWEVFEYVFGLPREANYVLDTAIDLIMDTLGAFVVYGVARFTLWRSA